MTEVEDCVWWLSEDVDEGDDDDLGDEAADFVRNRMMKKFVEGGKLFDGGETPAEKEIRKLDKIGQ